MAEIYFKAGRAAEEIKECLGLPFNTEQIVISGDVMVATYISENGNVNSINIEENKQDDIKIIIAEWRVRNIKEIKVKV